MLTRYFKKINKIGKSVIDTIFFALALSIQNKKIYIYILELEAFYIHLVRIKISDFFKTFDLWYLFYQKMLHKLLNR